MLWYCNNCWNFGQKTGKKNILTLYTKSALPVSETRKKIQESTEAFLFLSPQISPDQGSFEGRVVVVCEKMMSQPCWASSTQLVHSKNSRGMTLLHLAAAQGYAGLIQTLIRWRWEAHKHDSMMADHWEHTENAS